MNVSKDSSEPKKQVNKNIAMDAPKLPPKPSKRNFLPSLKKGCFQIICSQSKFQPFFKKDD